MGTVQDDDSRIVVLFDNSLRDLCENFASFAVKKGIYRKVRKGNPQRSQSKPCLNLAATQTRTTITQLMMNIAESLIKAEAALKSAKIENPWREAASLLCFAIGKDRTFLIAHPEYELQSEQNNLFTSIIKRRADREPFHHITGVKEFYGLDFEVSPDVLIPRPETEMLVAGSIEILAAIEGASFCEVGVGSGSIAISVLHHLPQASAVGLDISEAAIAVARRNAERHNVLDRLELLLSDVFSGLGQPRFELIVSNPPYVPVEEIGSLQREVRDFEPHLALTDGGNGLSIIEKIIQRSPFYLKPQGHLVLEIGINQSDAVTAMFDPEIWTNVDIVADFQGIPRMVVAGPILQ